MMVMEGKFSLCPAAKSLVSWAGVTFTQPVPKAGSTKLSATTGICRPVSGWFMSLPTMPL
jgi:hypothetical protein